MSGAFEHVSIAMTMISARGLSDKTRQSASLPACTVSLRGLYETTAAQVTGQLVWLSFRLHATVSHCGLLFTFRVRSALSAMHLSVGSLPSSFHPSKSKQPLDTAGLGRLSACGEPTRPAQPACCGPRPLWASTVTGSGKVPSVCPKPET